MKVKTEIPGSSEKPEKTPSVISLSDSDPETESQTEINLDQIETPITIEQTDTVLSPSFVATPVEKARREKSDRLSKEQLKGLMLKGQIPFEPPKLIDVIGKLEIFGTWVFILMFSRKVFGLKSEYSPVYRKTHGTKGVLKPRKTFVNHQEIRNRQIKN